ncbi:MAG: hypothetical protein ABH858_06480, partial [Candidatus Omnitrophota bacterium]
PAVRNFKGAKGDKHIIMLKRIKTLLIILAILFIIFLLIVAAVNIFLPKKLESLVKTASKRQSARI